MSKPPPKRGSQPDTPDSGSASSSQTPTPERGGVIKATTPTGVLVEFPRKEGESLIEAKGLFRSASPSAPVRSLHTAKEVLCILNTPYSPYGLLPPLPNPSNQLTVKLTVNSIEDVKEELHKLHSLPKIAIILFRDSEHKVEIKDGESLRDIDRIYWALEGDSPSSWPYKRDIIINGLKRASSQITEHMQTSTFLLENEYAWGKNLTIEEKRAEWVRMNNGFEILEHPPLLPLEINVQTGNYDNQMKIREVYEKLNPGWKETKEKIQQRIINIRTDKEQYEKNLKQLDSNFQVLRDEMYHLTGHLYPPFPNESLYSATFYDPIIPLPDKEDKEGLKDQTWKSMLNAINSNNLYYQQELGKYNMLKKEECHLISVYHQLMTRMKLWIFRERLRFVQWELQTADVFKERDSVVTSINLRNVSPLPVIKYEFPPKNVPKRSYQCIDFCQCEIGCSARIQAPFGSKKDD
jgi:hypothetical protein